MYPVKEEKTYAYIPQIQGLVVQAKLDDKLPMCRKRSLGDDDPRKISKTLAPKPPPATATLVEMKKSRFKSD